MGESEKVAGSFRDPSGFLFTSGGDIFRQVNKSYSENYRLLKSSGLYKKLAAEGLLIPHEEVEAESPAPLNAYKIIRPEPVPFISYPYEWCFSQLKHAALTTLAIQKISLEYGMSLKDASAYNIQFRDCKPVFIDTLSFETYRNGAPWGAYGQFCRHFLAPLALMAYKDACLNKLLRVYIDGVPLPLVSSLLPLVSRLKLPLFAHLHLHAKKQKSCTGCYMDVTRLKMSRLSLMGLVDNLESAVNSLNWSPCGTEWADYYLNTNYTENAMCRKAEVVSGFLERTSPGTVWDLGANTGVFSRAAAEKGIATAAFDSDPAAVEKNYLLCRESAEKCLPLLLDICNPSPGIGWDNRERMPLEERGPADCVLALALLHHLAISNNLPFESIAAFLGRCCSGTLIIEFIPKSDSQVRRLFSSREDIFDGYTRDAFEREFGRFFVIKEAARIEDSERTLYLMEKRSSTTLRQKHRTSAACKL